MHSMSKGYHTTDTSRGYCASEHILLYHSADLFLSHMQYAWLVLLPSPDKSARTQIKRTTRKRWTKEVNDKKNDVIIHHVTPHGTDQSPKMNVTVGSREKAKDRRTLLVVYVLPQRHVS